MSTIIAWVKKLFPLGRITGALVVVLVVLFIAGVAAKCHAGDRYIQVSDGETVIRGPAPVLDVGFAWDSGFRPGDFWKADLTLIGTSTFQGQPAPNNFVVRGLYETGFRFLDIGIGLSYMVNPYPYNGLNVNVNLEVAYRAQFLPITFTYSHLSDDGTRAPNFGRDMLMVGYRFQ